MSDTLTEKIQVRDLPPKIQKQMGLEDQPETQVEITVRAIMEDIDKRVAEVEAIFDEIKPVEIDRPLAEMIREEREKIDGRNS